MEKTVGLAVTIAAFVWVAYFVATDHSMEKCQKAGHYFDTCVTAFR
ncbi:hypothetical protein P11VFA_055 [Rhizobium phage P11VFA]|nr:hypothetical protein P11VFA_055 [Rhizobium phage P11VFA]